MTPRRGRPDGREPTARFEYRIFAPDLQRVRERIRSAARDEGSAAGDQNSAARGQNSAATGEGSDASDEFYLLGRRRDRNVKVRDGCLEVKALRDVWRSLERWEPVAREPLPAAGSWVRSELAEHLGIGRVEATRIAYRLDALLAEVLEPARVEVVHVRKQRERYAIAPVLAEFARVTVDRARLDTASVEGVDRHAVEARARRLGFDLPNRSYVRLLFDCRALGTR